MPETPIKVISDKIMVDPSLSASVLRLANSAGFVTRSKAESIPDAIKVIGIRNLISYTFRDECENGNGSAVQVV